jgi:hypothetical protein
LAGIALEVQQPAEGLVGGGLLDHRHVDVADARRLEPELGFLVLLADPVQQVVARR